MRRLFCFSIIFCIMLFGCAQPASVETSLPNETQTPAPTVQIPDYGGEMFIAIPEINIYNPLSIGNRQAANIYSLIYENFVNISIDGKIEPNIAQTWSVSEDGMTWTFKLRQGILWHDGTELKADDVIFTLEKINAMDATGSQYAKLNSLISAYASGAEDEYTVIITAKEPGNDCLYALSVPVISRKYYESDDALNTKPPMGSGPYKIGAFSRGSEMQLTVFESWWKKQPYITNIKVQEIKSHDEELPAFSTGILDFVATPVITANQLRQHDVINVNDYMTQYYDCLITNNESTILKNLEFRQALAYAIDKGDIISKDLMFHAVACDVLLPPDSWLYDSKYKLYEYNPIKSLDILKKLGYESKSVDGKIELVNAPTLKLIALFSDDAFYLGDVADNIQLQLGKIGINIEVDVLKWEDYKNALDNKQFDIALVSYYLDRNPNPRYILSSDGGGNYGGYRSEKMNELLNRLSKGTDETSIKELFNEYSQLFINELPHIPLYFRTNSAVYRSSIKNVGTLREDAIFNNITEWYIEVKPG